MLAPDYFYVIVGGGLAGLQLALKLSDDLFFEGKQIAIIDPSSKSENDKTWCFWEKGTSQWDSLIYREWSKGTFITSNLKKQLDLSPYSYKMIRAGDFYKYAHNKLEKKDNIHFVTDEILDIDPVTQTATSKKRKYTATHFFDSRVSSEYLENEKYTKIFQHFKGWLIETEEPSFNPDMFTMMDYRLKYKDSTSFTYVLPITKNQALIEYTFFTPYITEESIYDEMLKSYISNILKIENFKILETETGIIPMTDFPFEKENTQYITKIGTGGGWVKPSTGYSFKTTESKINLLVENIKSGRIPGQDLINARFKKYDAIFLDVLANNNDQGEEIFTKFYTKNTEVELLRYLDEETSLKEDLKIMLSLYHFEFIKSFFRKTF